MWHKSCGSVRVQQLLGFGTGRTTLGQVAQGELDAAGSFQNQGWALLMWMMRR